MNKIDIGNGIQLDSYSLFLIMGVLGSHQLAWINEIGGSILGPEESSFKQGKLANTSGKPTFNPIAIQIALASPFASSIRRVITDSLFQVAVRQANQEFQTKVYQQQHNLKLIKLSLLASIMAAAESNASFKSWAKEQTRKVNKLDQKLTDIINKYNSSNQELDSELDSLNDSINELNQRELDDLKKLHDESSNLLKELLEEAGFDLSEDILEELKTYENPELLENFFKDTGLDDIFNEIVGPTLAAEEPKKPEINWEKYLQLKMVKARCKCTNKLAEEVILNLKNSGVKLTPEIENTIRSSSNSLELKNNLDDLGFKDAYRAALTDNHKHKNHPKFRAICDNHLQIQERYKPERQAIIDRQNEIALKFSQFAMINVPKNFFPQEFYKAGFVPEQLKALQELQLNADQLRQTLEKYDISIDKPTHKEDLSLDIRNRHLDPIDPEGSGAQLDPDMPELKIPDDEPGVSPTPPTPRPE